MKEHQDHDLQEDILTKDPKENRATVNPEEELITDDRKESIFTENNKLCHWELYRDPYHCRPQR